MAYRREARRSLLKRSKEISPLFRRKATHHESRMNEINENTLFKQGNPLSIQYIHYYPEGPCRLRIHNKIHIKINLV